MISVATTQFDFTDEYLKGAINGSQFEDYQAPEMIMDEDEDQRRRDQLIDDMEDDAESIILTFANKQETRVYEKTNQIQKSALNY